MVDNNCTVSRLFAFAGAAADAGAAGAAAAAGAPAAAGAASCAADDPGDSVLWC